MSDSWIGRNFTETLAAEGFQKTIFRVVPMDWNFKESSSKFNKLIFQ